MSTTFDVTILNYRKSKAGHVTSPSLIMSDRQTELSHPPAFIQVEPLEQIASLIDGLALVACVVHAAAGTCAARRRNRGEESVCR